MEYMLMEIRGIVMKFSKLSQKDLSALSKAIAKRVLMKTLPPITKMELFLTEACNLRCDYCFVATKKAYKRMSAVIRKLDERRKIELIAEAVIEKLKEMEAFEEQTDLGGADDGGEEGEGNEEA